MMSTKMVNSPLRLLPTKIQVPNTYINVRKAAVITEGIIGVNNDIFTSSIHTPIGFNGQTFS